MEKSHFEIYKKKQLERINQKLEDLPKEKPEGNYFGAWGTLQFEIFAFLKSFGLSLVEQEKGEINIEIWEKEPKILMPDFFDGGKLYKVVKTNQEEQELNFILQLVVLEVQEYIMFLLGFSNKSTFTLYHLISKKVSTYVISKITLFLSSLLSFDDDYFWTHYISPSKIFHFDVIANLERIAKMTYENEQATIAIIIINTNLSEKFRISNFIQYNISFLEREKFVLKLSDGDNTTFLYSSTGEFLGFYDLNDLTSKLVDTPKYFLWKVEKNRAITGYYGEEKILTFSQGEWQYLHQEKDFLAEKIKQHYPTSKINFDNIWNLCKNLSSDRKGALIIVVDNLDTLIAERIVNDNELIHEKSFFQKYGDEKDEPILIAYEYPLPFKEYILEQYKNININDISLNILMSFATIDGAVIIDNEGFLKGFGVIISKGLSKSNYSGVGARTTAAKIASDYGIAIKISEDGPISIFKNGTEL